MATRTERFEKTIGAGPGLSGTVKIDFSRIDRTVAELTAGLPLIALESVERAMAGVIRDLQSNKLSGSPAPVRNSEFPRGGHYLAVRTGRGRASIRGVIEATDARVRGIFGPNHAGKPDPGVYMAAHEQGFSGTVSIPGHTRRGRPVRPHQRRVDIPARRFMRAALLEGRRTVQQIVLETLEMHVKRASSGAA